MEVRDPAVADPSRVAALAALHTADRQELTQLDLQLITIAGILSVYVGAVYTAWVPNAGNLPWGIYVVIPYPPLLIWSVFLSRLVLARVIIHTVTLTADRLALMAGLSEGSVSVPAHLPKNKSLAARFVQLLTYLGLGVMAISLTAISMVGLFRYGALWVAIATSEAYFVAYFYVAIRYVMFVFGDKGIGRMSFSSGNRITAQSAVPSRRDQVIVPSA